MMRIITCENENGLGIKFGLTNSPWKLLRVEGLYKVSADVYTSDNTMTDGSTYQGSTLKERNIILTMEDRPFAHQTSRKLLYDVFKTKAKGTFTYLENGDSRIIKYIVEDIEIDDLGSTRKAVISLICPDPNFESPNDVTVVIAGWSDIFEFEFEIPEDGYIEFEEKTDEKLKTINNDSGSDGIGVTFTIKANGDITNPTIAKIETQEYFTLGTDDEPFEMHIGDIVTITTHTNDKHVYLTRDGVKTECNEYQTEDSEYIQLMRGDNTIGFNANEGVEHMDVTIEYRYKYPGV